MKKKKRGRICAFAFIALACIAWALTVQAQDYPRSPVQVVIPFGPGGSTDIFWRGVSDVIARNMNGTITLVNKPGGGGAIGMSFVVNSRPDGYTLATGNSDPLNIAPLFSPNIPYDTEKDFTYIAKAADFIFTFAVPAGSPFKTLEEVVAFAKANPGKLKSGVPGVGTTPHMIVEVFNRDAKVEITPVPFAGGGEVVTNLLGGHLDLAVISIAPIKPHQISGKARVLAVCYSKRFPGLPQVPSTAEKGYKASNIATGIGLVGPKGLPPAVVKRWEDALEKSMKDPKVMGIIEKLDGFVIDYKSGEAYKKEILGDMGTFKPIVTALPAKK